MLTASQTLGLMFLIPTVVKWGRPLYARFHRSSPRPSDDPLDDSRSEATSSHFDVWLLSVSLIIDALIIATFGLARTKWQLMLGEQAFHLINLHHLCINRSSCRL